MYFVLHSGIYGYQVCTAIRMWFSRATCTCSVCGRRPDSHRVDILREESGGGRVTKRGMEVGMEGEKERGVERKARAQMSVQSDKGHFFLFYHWINTVKALRNVVLLSSNILAPALAPHIPLCIHQSLPSCVLSVLLIKLSENRVTRGAL